MGVHAVKFGLNLCDVVKSGQCLLHHGSPLVVFHDLRQVADTQIVRLVDASGCRRLKPADQFHDRGLPRSVFADKTDLVLLTDVEIYTVQKCVATVGHSQSIN